MVISVRFRRKPIERMQFVLRDFWRLLYTTHICCINKTTCLILWFISSSSYIQHYTHVPSVCWSVTSVSVKSKENICSTDCINLCSKRVRFTFYTVCIQQSSRLLPMGSPKQDRCRSADWKLFRWSSFWEFIMICDYVFLF